MFEGARAVRVPRTRFVPVKTTGVVPFEWLSEAGTAWHSTQFDGCDRVVTL